MLFFFDLQGIYLHYNCICSVEWQVTRGTGIRGLMRGMATLPQGNQELLVVRDKVGRPQVSLGVSKSMECDIFPSSHRASIPAQFMIATVRVTCYTAR